MHESITGLILAGGASRRFGTDKARVAVEGRAMIARVFEAVSAVTDEVLVSVREGGGDYGLAARVVEDAVPGAGPLAGLEAGLRACRTPWLLVVACDMPFLTAEALDAVTRQRAPGLDAVVAQTPDGRLQPLCACYSAAILPVVEAQLRSGRRSMRGLLERLGAVRVAPLPEAPRRNVNRPGDLKGNDS